MLLVSPVLARGGAQANDRSGDVKKMLEEEAKRRVATQAATRQGDTRGGTARATRVHVVLSTEGCDADGDEDLPCVLPLEAETATDESKGKSKGK